MSSKKHNPIYNKELDINLYKVEDRYILNEEDIGKAIYNIHIITNHGRRDKINSYLKKNSIYIKNYRTTYKIYINDCYCNNSFKKKSSNSNGSLNLDGTDSTSESLNKEKRDYQDIQVNNDDDNNNKLNDNNEHNNNNSNDSNIDESKALEELKQKIAIQNEKLKYLIEMVEQIN